MFVRLTLHRLARGAALGCLLLAALAPAGAQSVLDPFVDRLATPELRQFVDEMLVRNPRLAAAEARARAAGYVAPQVRALPDPTVGVTGFVESPETRVGPQELMLTASQALPWRGKRQTQGEAADLEASALAAEADALRLTLLTDLRLRLLDLGFVDRLTRINRSIRDHLAQHEQIARARYATGSGPGQGVVKLQAAITGVDHRLLELEARRLELEAAINALRDRPPSVPLPALDTVPAAPPELAAEALIELALERRPDLLAAQRRIERAASLERLADIARRPDFKVGLTYTLVGERDDEPGRLQPPPGNGDDILGLQAGVSIPLWRTKLDAGVAQAAATSRHSAEQRRAIKAGLERDVHELVAQLPIRWRQLDLLRRVLLLQAQEALDSATSGYVAGTLNALDLLDAEHVLFETETAIARAETDYFAAWVRLEGALGAPLAVATKETSR